MEIEKTKVQLLEKKKFELEQQEQVLEEQICNACKSKEREKQIQLEQSKLIRVQVEEEEEQTQETQDVEMGESSNVIVCKGHTAEVFACAWDPSDTLLATGYAFYLVIV